MKAAGGSVGLFQVKGKNLRRLSTKKKKKKKKNAPTGIEP